MSRRTVRFAPVPRSIVALATTVTLLVATARASAEKIEVPGLGDPGSLTAIAFEETGGTTIAGPEYRLQLLVTGEYSSGQVRDLTRDVNWRADPPDIVDIDQTGLVKPLADGPVTVTARTADGKSATIGLLVTAFAAEQPISFANEVMPVFTKLGCNSGSCHGKSGGQNGFALSLLGFYPRDDYGPLTSETLGRRISIAQPDRSLLLLKSTGTIGHSGGKRLDVDSSDYRIMRRWIAQGAQYGDENVRKVNGLEVFPQPRRLPRGGTQQLSVVASYMDGSREDVTRLARYESNNNDICDASKTGLLTIKENTGNLAVMIRYQGAASVFSGTVPMGLPVTDESLPPSKSMIDELANRKFKDLGLPPSGRCSDATFLRRVTIDIAGRLPTLEEATLFLADKDAARRDKLVDRLLASTDYADYFARKWSLLLRNRPEDYELRNYGDSPMLIFHAWIRDALHGNQPYDQFVRDLVAASGHYSDNPAVVWYKRVNAHNVSMTEKTLVLSMEDAAQMFLGTRLQCAKCHHHPFEKWSQDDYYGMMAFFSRVRKKKLLTDVTLGFSPSDKAQHRAAVSHSRGIAQWKNPRTGQMVKAAAPGQPPADISPDSDPRHLLVDWMTAPDNRFFAPALVNRYWKHFFGRGLVEPEDDIRVTNPPTNPELLNGLARHFIKSGFDLKDLVRTIATSNLYQLTALPTEYNREDKQNFSHFYTRRINAEVLSDALDALTGSQSTFSGTPTGTRAVQLPHGGLSNAFLSTFGMPSGESACECERNPETTLGQTLALVNSPFVLGKLNADTGRAARLAADDGQSLEEKVHQLYLVAYSRPPLAAELQAIKVHIELSKDRKLACADVVWALVNTKEFVFSH